MPVIGSDSMQIAMCPESVQGVVNTNPQWRVMRITGETLVFQPQFIENDELGASGRSAPPADVVGATVNGQINFRLSKQQWFDLALTSLLGNEWGKCPLPEGGDIHDAGANVVGQKVKTFTIEKRFPNPEQYGSFLYQRFVGCTFSALTLNITPNQVITGTFSIIGGTPHLSGAMLTGSTYISPATTPAFTAPNVIGLRVGAAYGDVLTNCWNEITITLDSQNRGIPCIGTTGDREVVLGTFKAELAGNVYFTRQDILQIILDNGTLGDVFIEMSDKGSPEYFYSLQMFSAKPINGTLNAAGQNQDLMIPLTLQGTPRQICSGAYENWRSPIIINNVDAGMWTSVETPNPEPITVDEYNTATKNPYIVFAGGPTGIASTFNLEITTDTITPAQTVSYAIPAGMSKGTAVLRILDAINLARDAGDLSQDITAIRSATNFNRISFGISASPPDLSTTYATLVATITTAVAALDAQGNIIYGADGYPHPDWSKATTEVVKVEVGYDPDPLDKDGNYPTVE